MKLRNKKTGKVIDGFITTIQWNNKLRINHRGGQPFKDYNSLAELNEEWEDYVPREPLIKDEKIRKAVRAWAVANGITQVFYNACWNSFNFQDFMITFDHDFDRHDGLKDGQKYTITELCGEEEE